MDLCVQCTRPLRVQSDGSRIQCCKGAGYLSAHAPLQKDYWWPIPYNRRTGLYTYKRAF